VHAVEASGTTDTRPSIFAYTVTIERPLMTGLGVAATQRMNEDPELARRFRDATLPHLDAVYAFARCLLRDPADAEDAVQECYLRALRNIHALRSPEAKPWLLTILLNVCRDEFNRRSRIILYGVNAEPDQLEATTPLWRDMEPTPEAEMLRKFDAETIRRLVAVLPDEFREVIVLREVTVAQIQNRAERDLSRRAAQPGCATPHLPDHPTPSAT
jgi:RNA polymerase sigma-70 factor, ECF subfamily